MKDLKKVISEQGLTAENQDKIIELLENPTEQEIVKKASIYSIFDVQNKEFFKVNRFALKRKKKLIENFSKKIASFLPIETKVKTKGHKVLPEFEIKGNQKTFAFSSNFVKFDKTGIAKFSSEGMIETHALAHGFFNIVANSSDIPKVDIFFEILTKLDNFTSIEEVKDFIASIETEAENIFENLVQFKNNIIDNR